MDELQSAERSTFESELPDCRRFRATSSNTRRRRLRISQGAHTPKVAAPLTTAETSRSAAASEQPMSTVGFGVRHRLPDRRRHVAASV